MRNFFFSCRKKQVCMRGFFILRGMVVGTCCMAEMSVRPLTSHDWILTIDIPKSQFINIYHGPQGHE